MTGGLNWYDLYRPVYPDSGLLLQGSDREETSMVEGVEKTYKKGMLQSEYTPWMKNTLKSKHLLGNGVSTYVNRADVRKALHIPASI